MSIVSCHLCAKAWRVPTGQGEEAWRAHYKLAHSDLEAERRSL